MNVLPIRISISSLDAFQLKRSLWLKQLYVVREMWEGSNLFWLLSFLRLLSGGPPNVKFTNS